MNNEQAIEHDTALSTDPDGPSDARLEATFNEKFRETEGRIGPEGYWILPLLLFSLALLFGSGRLILWAAATMLDW